MKKQKKIHSRPKRPFNKTRIDEEAKIKQAYGLKNKKEIWRAEARVRKMREKAKKLITAGAEEQKKLFERLNKRGIKVESIADILSLETKDYLERRLQTILVRKKLTNTMKSARQLITHKKVLVNDRIIDSPSYIVLKKLEDKIKLKDIKKQIKKEKPKKEESEVEIKETELKEKVEEKK